MPGARAVASGSGRTLTPGAALAEVKPARLLHRHIRDRYLVDGLVNVVSAWTVMAGGGLLRIQTGRVQDYVLGVAAGVLALLWWLGGLQ